MRSLRLTVSEKCLRRLPDAAPVSETFKARPYIRANYPTRMRLKIKTQKRNEGGRAFSINYRLFVASLIFKPRTAAELTKDGAEYSTNRLVRNYNCTTFPEFGLAHLLCHQWATNIIRRRTTATNCHVSSCRPN